MPLFIDEEFLPQFFYFLGADFIFNQIVPISISNATNILHIIEIYLDALVGNLFLLELFKLVDLLDLFTFNFRFLILWHYFWTWYIA